MTFSLIYYYVHSNPADHPERKTCCRAGDVLWHFFGVKSQICAEIQKPQHIFHPPCCLWWISVDVFQSQKTVRAGRLFHRSTVNQLFWSDDPWNCWSLIQASVNCEYSAAFCLSVYRVLDCSYIQTKQDDKMYPKQVKSVDGESKRRFSCWSAHF